MSLIFIIIQVIVVVYSTKPCIIVPGLGASRLEAKLENVHQKHWFCRRNTSEYYDLWLAFDELIPYLSAECLSHNIDVFFNCSSSLFSNNQGVSIRPVLFGSTLGVEYLMNSLKKQTKIFMDFVDFLVSKGYKRGFSVRGAPFDFRLGPKNWAEEGGFFQSLKGLIEETYTINGKSSVHLVVHSLGGPNEH